MFDNFIHRLANKISWEVEANDGSVRLVAASSGYMGVASEGQGGPFAPLTDDKNGYGNKTFVKIFKRFSLEFLLTPLPASAATFLVFDIFHKFSSTLLLSESVSILIIAHLDPETYRNSLGDRSVDITHVYITGYRNFRMVVNTFFETKFL